MKFTDNQVRSILDDMNALKADPVPDWLKGIIVYFASFGIGYFILWIFT